MDRAFWITWYDLPDEGRAAYLDWLHNTYIPKVTARPGVLWAAHYASESNIVPQGGGKGRVEHARGGGEPAREAIKGRSEERRVGKECRSRWSPYH